MDNDRTILETAQRERDRLAAEKHQFQNTIAQNEDEINQLKRKIERLNSEIDEYGSSGANNAEVSPPFYVIYFNGIILLRGPILANNFQSC
jgi:hypothetical protein